jgi:tRNA-specific 2-thiouridylase
LGLPDTSPWYVLAVEAGTNTIVVGKEEDLYKDSIIINKVSWPSGSPPQDGEGYQVKIRYTHRGAEAQIIKLDDERYRIIFKEKQRAITPGQFAVIYQNNEVVGSGEILKEER